MSVPLVELSKLERQEECGSQECDREAVAG